MTLTWTENSSYDGNAMGFDSQNRLVGQVVWYDDVEPGRPGQSKGRFWAGFTSGNRVPGKYATKEEAARAVEAALRE